MNQNGKGNVNLSTNNTDSAATGVKLTEKSDKTSVKDATKDKDLWNQNNKHKGKNNNDDDSGKKLSKDLDKKSANGDADKVKAEFKIVCFFPFFLNRNLSKIKVLVKKSKFLAKVIKN